MIQFKAGKFSELRVTKGYNDPLYLGPQTLVDTPCVVRESESWLEKKKSEHI